jgi:hypothetical protein
MYRSRLSQIVVIASLLALSACATPPRHINNVCAVFDQRDGWFHSWERAAENASRKYGIPVPVLMATIRNESGFKGNAKPPRKWVLGFIPWGRVSSAYGFSQALDGTWSQYRQETGNFMARRRHFADAVDFVGWYYAKSAALFGIAKNDTYHLYLTYYLGWSAYRRGDWRNNAAVQRYARRTARMAVSYDAQLRECE